MLNFMTKLHFKRWNVCKLLALSFCSQKMSGKGILCRFLMCTVCHISTESPQQTKECSDWEATLYAWFEEIFLRIMHKTFTSYCMSSIQNALKNLRLWRALPLITKPWLWQSKWSAPCNFVATRVDWCWDNHKARHNTIHESNSKPVVCLHPHNQSRPVYFLILGMPEQKKRCLKRTKLGMHSIWM